MYYHARPLKYVEYGKVYGNPDPGDGWDNCYKWLSNFCGYFPHVWLSRNRNIITGIRSHRDNILFAFDVIKGFPLHYEWWCLMMGNIWSSDLRGWDPVDDADKVNEYVFDSMKEFYGSVVQDGYTSGIISELEGDPRDFSSAEEWLEKCVFVKYDQVVLPSLNLKVAKEVFCRTDKEKKKLRKMGFIEDRIKIRKFPDPWG